MPRLYFTTRIKNLNYVFIFEKRSNAFSLHINLFAIKMKRYCLKTSNITTLELNWTLYLQGFNVATTLLEYLFICRSPFCLIFSYFDSISKVFSLNYFKKQLLPPIGYKSTSNNTNRRRAVRWNNYRKTYTGQQKGLAYFILRNLDFGLSLGSQN